jgi:hypothetical protein
MSPEVRRPAGDAGTVVDHVLSPREIQVLVPSTALTTAIRREILSVLASSDAMTMPAATEQVALTGSVRRQRLGESPSSVRAAEAIAFQVGVDLAAEVAAPEAAGRATRRGGHGPGPWSLPARGVVAGPSTPSSPATRTW